MHYNSAISEIDVQQLALRLAQVSQSLQLVDVRERSEANLAKIEGFDLYPLSEIEQWSEKIFTCLQPEAETIVLCHHGRRSAQMCQWLATRGFSNLYNVMGGIDAYSLLVDSTIYRY